MSEQRITALMVSADILRIADRHRIAMNVRQLLNLTYLAYGWWTVERPGERLFDCRIEACREGPTISDIWLTFQRFGWDRIPRRVFAGRLVIEDPAILHFLDGIVCAYGPLSINVLLDILYEPSVPWERVCRHGETGIEILPENIERHFKAHADSLRKAA